MSVSQDTGITGKTGITEFPGLAEYSGLVKQRPGGNVFVPLGNLVPSCVCDLDATITASYPGSGQTWANLEPTPADGAAQTDYDFWLGIDGLTSNDPTFNGSAGDPAAYFDIGGTKWFSLKAAIGSLPPLLRDMHKNNQSFWVAIGARSPAAYGSTHDGYFGNTGNSWEDGVRMSSITTVNAFRVNRVSGTENQQTFDPKTGDEIPINTNFLLIISHEATTHAWRAWYNSATATNSGTTADIVGAQDAGTTAGLNFAIGAGNSAGANSGNARRQYSFALGNEFIGDAQAALISAQLQFRHQRDYTP